MKITIELTEENLKSNIVLQSLKQMLQANTTINIDSSIKENKAITSDFDNLEDLLPPHQQKPLKSTENTQKSKGKSKEERVQILKDFANSKWKSLTDAQKKSMKSFVAFYEKKIMEQDFNINPAKSFTQWWQNDKNNK